MLQNALRRERLAHAYIFSGPDRAGKKQMALELAKALNCERQTADACGSCTTCTRIAHGNYPDVHWVQPEGKSVKIEQIRGLQKKFAYRTLESKVSVFIVEAAETMTGQAANSLLKFLEEPGDGVVAILLADHVHNLLPTVVSRCQLVPFRVLSAEKVSEQLEAEGILPQTARVVAHVADGLEAARQLAHAESFREAIKLVQQLSEATRVSSGQAVVAIQEKVMASDVSRDHLNEFIDLMILWYKDMLNIMLGCRQPLTFSEQKEVLQRQATNWTISRLVQAIEHMLFVKRQLKQHVPPQLALEGWVLSVREG